MFRHSKTNNIADINKNIYEDQIKHAYNCISAIEQKRICRIEAELETLIQGAFIRIAIKGKEACFGLHKLQHILNSNENRKKQMNGLIQYNRSTLLAKECE